MTKEELLFCPLGGSGEIGGNMNLYAYGKENDQKWIIVDMGVSFADDSVPGVDLIMPDAGFIIDKKDKVYSPLALYYLLDNNYINSQNDINLLFDKIISIKQSNEKKHLIIFKKALFNLDNFTENQMLETLSPVINSDSVWKAHGLLLMAEFYLDKKEFIKSKEFFTKVSEIENLNQNIKQDVQKKLSREFSE